MVLQGVCIIFSLVLLKTLTASTLYNRLIGYEAFLKSTHSHVFSKNRKHLPIFSSENCQYLQPLNNCNMSRVMRKLAFSICENKDADQLRVFVFAYPVTAKLISAFGFAIRRVQSLYFLNPKSQASNHLLWTRSNTPKTVFLTTRIILHRHVYFVFQEKNCLLHIRKQRRR